MVIFGVKRLVTFGDTESRLNCKMDICITRLLRIHIFSRYILAIDKYVNEIIPPSMQRIFLRRLIYILCLRRY